MKRGKKYLKVIEQVDKLRYYELDEAVDLIKKTATAKFNETVELATRLGPPWAKTSTSSTRHSPAP